MLQIEPKSAPNSRAVAKERRREQLIKATINCIAKRGIAGTTMADVTKDAGLSLGIVNLHFQSKDKLFEETLDYLSVEYEASWVNALRNAGDSAVEKLTAMVKSDFSAKVCERKKLAVWFAFWGEAKSRPTYLHTCAQSDKKITPLWHSCVRNWQKKPIMLIFVQRHSPLGWLLCQTACGWIY